VGQEATGRGEEGRKARGWRPPATGEELWSEEAPTVSVSVHWSGERGEREWRAKRRGVGLSVWE